MTQAPSLHLRGTYNIGDDMRLGPVDMTLPAGRWTCVLGRTGVGKSTLLRLIAGLDCPGAFNGKITVSDERPLNGRISYMTQSDLLLPWLSVRDNVVLGARLRGQPPDFERAAFLLDRVGLGAHQHKTPGALSGGMRQRTALVRTLMEDRPVALLDEPFSALDASTRADMQELTAEMLAGKTVLLITHDPAEAVRLADQILVLTSKGMTPWPLPNSVPVRDQYDPETLNCQAGLLAYLRAPA